MDQKQAPSARRGPFGKRRCFRPRHPGGSWCNLPGRWHHAHDPSLGEPARAAPKYQGPTKLSIPEVLLPVKKVGSALFPVDMKRQAERHRRLLRPMLDVRLRPGGRMGLATPGDYNTAVLALSGKSPDYESSEVSGEFILFHNDGDEVQIRSLSESMVLFLNGERIEEPLVPTVHSS